MNILEEIAKKALNNDELTEAEVNILIQQIKSKTITVEEFIEASIQRDKKLGLLDDTPDLSKEYLAEAEHYVNNLKVDEYPLDILGWMYLNKN